LIVVTQHRRRRRDDDALFLGLSSFDAWAVCAYDAIFSYVDENDRISTPVKEGGKKGAHIFFKTNGDENETTRNTCTARSLPLWYQRGAYAQKTPPVSRFCVNEEGRKRARRETRFHQTRLK
jgi:hypothetical protein